MRAYKVFYIFGVLLIVAGCVSLAGVATFSASVLKALAGGLGGTFIGIGGFVLYLGKRVRERVKQLEFLGRR